MKFLFLGDIVATPGRQALSQHLPALRQKLALTGVVANGENAASGRGITAESAAEIFAAGVDVITLGDHTFDQKDVEQLLSTQSKVLRPANFPPGTVGRGHGIFTLAGGVRLGVISLQGRVFMKHQIDCPFQLSKKLMADYRLTVTCDALIVDIHAEATSEKAAMGHVWDGHASLVVGTHTHIPTADTRLQPRGTAFQTDAGMCGDYHSSLGMSLDSTLPGYFTIGRHKFQPATGPASLSGVVVTVGANGLATAVAPLRLGGILSPTA